MAKTSIKLIIFCLLVLISGCKKKRDPSKLEYARPFASLTQDAFLLGFTTSLEGYVEPCGCTSDPLGGIARFTQVFGDISIVSKKNISLIDSGNLLFESPTRHPADLCQDDARIDLLLSTLHKLGLRTTISGSLDSARGDEYRDGWYKKYQLTNLALHEPLLLSNQDYFIALISLTEPNNLMPIISKLRENQKIKAIIALSQIPQERVKELFTNFSHLDLIIQGQVSSPAPTTPIKLGEQGPWFLAGGRQGQYFTLLALENISKRGSESLKLDTRAFERNGRALLLKTRINGLKTQLEHAKANQIDFLAQRLQQSNKELAVLEKLILQPYKQPSIQFHAIALNKNIDSDHEVKNKLNKYEASIPALVGTCEQNISCPKAQNGAKTFVGAQNCKNCHQAAYETWQQAQFLVDAVDESGQAIKRKVGHSKAWLTLKEVKKDKDRSCIACHSIGFMEVGGYCKASEVDFRIDVQCESCHGPGSLHAVGGDKAMIQRTVSENTCRTCHHVPHIPSFESFNYEEKLMKILGPGHGEKLLKELKHKVQIRD